MKALRTVCGSLLFSQMLLASLTCYSSAEASVAFYESFDNTYGDLSFPSRHWKATWRSDGRLAPQQIAVLKGDLSLNSKSFGFVEIKPAGYPLLLWKELSGNHPLFSALNEVRWFQKNDPGNTWRVVLRLEKEGDSLLLMSGDVFTNERASRWEAQTMSLNGTLEGWLVVTQQHNKPMAGMLRTSSPPMHHNLPGARVTAVGLASIEQDGILRMDDLVMHSVDNVSKTALPPLPVILWIAAGLAFSVLAACAVLHVQAIEHAIHDVISHHHLLHH